MECSLPPDAEDLPERNVLVLCNSNNVETCRELAKPWKTLSCLYLYYAQCMTNSMRLNSSILLVLGPPPLVLLAAQIPPHTLITSNHQPTSRRDLPTPGRETRKERSTPLRSDHMHRKAQRLGVWQASCRRGEDLSSGFEDVEWLSEEGGDCTGHGAGDEGCGYWGE